MIVRGGFAGFGDLVDSYPALYKRLKDARARMAETALAPLSKSIPFRLYAQVVRKQADNAAANLREVDGLSFVTDSQLKQLADIAEKLDAIADAAEAQAYKTPNATITPVTARVWVQRYQDWLTRLTGVAIISHDATVGAANRAPAKVKKAAKKVVQTALEVPKMAADAARDALGIPKWLVPVALVVVGGALLFPYVAPGIIKSVKGGGT